MAKEGRLITYQDRTKQYKQNWTFQNNQQVGGEWEKTYHLPDAKEAKTFRERKDQNKKSRMDKQHHKVSCDCLKTALRYKYTSTLQSNLGNI